MAKKQKRNNYNAKVRVLMVFKSFPSGVQVLPKWCSSPSQVVFKSFPSGVQVLPKWCSSPSQVLVRHGFMKIDRKRNHCPARKQRRFTYIVLRKLLIHYIRKSTNKALWIKK